MAKKEDLSKYFEQANEEFASTFNVFDPSQADLLFPQWNGEYEVRFLPLTTKEMVLHDYFRPVGMHWNIVTSSDGDNQSRRPLVCPRFTKRVMVDEDGTVTAHKDTECPICDSINTLIAEGKATARDFSGQDSPTLRKTYMIRALLLSFEESKGGNKKKPPEFKDLPVQKIIQMPVSLAKKIKDKLNSKYLGGPDVLFNPEKGKRIILRRTDDGQVSYDFDILDSWPIPEEFLNDEEFIPIDRVIPNDSADSIRAVLNENRHNHPELARIACSLSTKALPASDGSDDLDAELAKY